LSPAPAICSQFSIAVAPLWVGSAASKKAGWPVTGSSSTCVWAISSSFTPSMATPPGFSAL
jgi:hypothetical protein